MKGMKEMKGIKEIKSPIFTDQLKEIAEVLERLD